MRRGEMAKSQQVLFGRYYGTVDATPLFVVLAGAYLDRSDDIAFIETIWPDNTCRFGLDRQDESRRRP